jgi:hypothetical protein
VCIFKRDMYWKKWKRRNGCSLVRRIDSWPRSASTRRSWEQQGKKGQVAIHFPLARRCSHLPNKQTYSTRTLFAFSQDRRRKKAHSFSCPISLILLLVLHLPHPRSLILVLCHCWNIWTGRVLLTHDEPGRARQTRQRSRPVTWLGAFAQSSEVTRSGRSIRE